MKCLKSLEAKPISFNQTNPSSHMETNTKKVKTNLKLINLFLVVLICLIFIFGGISFYDNFIQNAETKNLVIDNKEKENLAEVEKLRAEIETLKRNQVNKLLAFEENRKKIKEEMIIKEKAKDEEKAKEEEKYKIYLSFKKAKTLITQEYDKNQGSPEENLKEAIRILNEVLKSEDSPYTETSKELLALSKACISSSVAKNILINSNPKFDVNTSGEIEKIDSDMDHFFFPIKLLEDNVPNFNFYTSKKPINTLSGYWPVSDRIVIIGNFGCVFEVALFQKIKNEYPSDIYQNKVRLAKEDFLKQYNRQKATKKESENALRVINLQDANELFKISEKPEEYVGSTINIPICFIFSSRFVRNEDVEGHLFSFKFGANHPDLCQNFGSSYSVSRKKLNFKIDSKDWLNIKISEQIAWQRLVNFFGSSNLGLQSILQKRNSGEPLPIPVYMQLKITFKKTPTIGLRGDEYVFFAEVIKMTLK